MHPRRLARLNQLILQNVSKTVLNLKDPSLGFVTIIGAETTPDVSLVRVYYSVFGELREREETAAALDRAKSMIRRQVGRLENLRRVPDLMFVYDQSVDRAARVNQILSEIHQEKETNQSDESN